MFKFVQTEIYRLRRLPHGPVVPYALYYVRVHMLLVPHWLYCKCKLYSKKKKGGKDMGKYLYIDREIYNVFSLMYNSKLILLRTDICLFCPLCCFNTLFSCTSFCCDVFCYIEGSVLSSKPHLFSLSLLNRRSSEIQGTALGKSLQAWICIYRSMPAGVAQSRHAFCWGYSEHVGKMTDTRKQMAKKASEIPIKHSPFVGNMQIG